MTIGRKIKMIRTKQGLTQKQLGELIGVSQAAIAQFEKSNYTLQEDTLYKIANALKIKPIELTDGTNPWSKFNEKYPNMGEQVARYGAWEKYLINLGFDLASDVTKWHYEDEIDESGNVIGQSQVEDEREFILSKNGESATFTQEEFKMLQSATEEVIEGQFYKKVRRQLIDQKKL